MSSLFDIRAHVDNLRESRKLRDLVGFILQLVVVLAFFCAIRVWWRGWFPGEYSGLKFFGWVALIVWQLAWPVAVFFALQALFLRFSEIRRLPESRYAVAPMVELLLRGAGEAVLAASLVLAIPAMLAVWCNGLGLVVHLIPRMPSLVTVIGFASDGARFWWGLGALVVLPLQGLIALLGAYFSAEAIVALFAIADDVSALRSKRDEAADQDAEASE